MSQETPTDLPEMPSTAPPGAEGSTALSLSEVDQRSASRMLRVLVIFGWGMAAAVVVSALLGFGTPLSNTLVFCWFAALTLLLLLWSKLTLQWHRGVALAMLCFVIARWAVAWLYADAADAMVGVVTGLLYAPLLVAVTTLIWGPGQPIYRREYRTDHGRYRLHGERQRGAVQRSPQRLAHRPINLMCLRTLFLVT